MVKRLETAMMSEKTKACVLYRVTAAPANTLQFNIHANYVKYSYQTLYATYVHNVKTVIHIGLVAYVVLVEKNVQTS